MEQVAAEGQQQEQPRGQQQRSPQQQPGPSVSKGGKNIPLARMGNLGWDQNEQTLLLRARESLEVVGVPETAYQKDSLAACRTPGPPFFFPVRRAVGIDLKRPRWLHTFG